MESVDHNSRCLVDTIRAASNVPARIGIDLMYIRDGISYRAEFSKFAGFEREALGGV